MLKINTISIALKGQQIIHDISCSLQTGRITTFVGPSGAGKTTLLKAVAGLVPLQSGNIFLNGRSIHNLSDIERAQSIGYLFQDFNLFPHMTVLENCLDPLLIRGISFAVAQAEVCVLLEKVGLIKYKNKFPSELSGGQKQRVAFVRMLSLKPTVLLLDEPTASLDQLNTDILVKLLQECAAQGLIIGVSTQDSSFAKKIIDCIYCIIDGVIVEECKEKSLLNQCQVVNQFI